MLRCVFERVFLVVGREREKQLSKYEEYGCHLYIFVKILGKYKGEFLIFGKFRGHGAQGSM